MVGSQALLLWQVCSHFLDGIFSCLAQKQDMCVHVNWTNGVYCLYIADHYVSIDRCSNLLKLGIKVSYNPCTSGEQTIIFIVYVSPTLTLSQKYCITQVTSYFP